MSLIDRPSPDTRGCDRYVSIVEFRYQGVRGCDERFYRCCEVTAAWATIDITKTFYADGVAAAPSRPIHPMNRSDLNWNRQMGTMFFPAKHR